MGVLIAFALLTSLAAAVTAFSRAMRAAAASRAQTRFDALLPDVGMLAGAVESFAQLADGTQYLGHRALQRWVAEYKDREWVASLDLSLVRGDAAAIDVVRRFALLVADPVAAATRHNEAFVAEEMRRLPALLGRHGIPHNDDQLRAIATDEDSVLVVAGAGTGKTTTIEGKVAYLVEERGVDPRDILLVSFTKKAAGELVERMHRISPHMEVRTFNAFGLSVIRQVRNDAPTIAFEDEASLRSFVDATFQSLLRDGDYLRTALRYFAYYLHPVELLPGFASLDEYFRYQKATRTVTIAKEKVKSAQEAMIANFLLLHGIRYEYERPYEHRTSTKAHAQYRPDFFLPDHKVYLEHFGIGRGGGFGMREKRDANDEISRRYREAMAWKRALHQRHRTVLVETFSYEFFEDNWQELLAAKLRAVGVPMAEHIDPERLQKLFDPKEVLQISRFFATFLTLLKSGRFSLEEVQQKARDEKRWRDVMFLSLFAPVYREYQRHLADADAIDFSDMLSLSADMIADGRFTGRYRYLIVDEFQDISAGKYALVQALRTVNPEMKTYCVGDDWQAIYRFAGSDVSLMTDIERYFGHTARLALEVSNRFPEEIAKATNAFVQKNPSQIRKNVRSLRTAGRNLIHVAYYAGAEDANERILGSLPRNEKASVLLIGRFSLKHSGHVTQELLDRWRAQFPHLRIDYLTAHSAKGLTVDYAIVQDLVGGTMGFPSGIVDDPLLHMVLQKGEDYPHAEERRLMYVAMTRARKEVWMLTERNNESPFVAEFANAQPKKNPCPSCGGELVTKTGPYGPFLACRNFPYCTYKRRR